MLPWFIYNIKAFKIVSAVKRYQWMAKDMGFNEVDDENADEVLSL